LEGADSEICQVGHSPSQIPRGNTPVPTSGTGHLSRAGLPGCRSRFGVIRLVKYRENELRLGLALTHIRRR
jgi:hypothetical protein